MKAKDLVIAMRGGPAQKKEKFGNPSFKNVFKDIKSDWKTEVESDDLSSSDEIDEDLNEKENAFLEANILQVIDQFSDLY